MPLITLTKASRVQERIREAIRAVPLAPRASFSIFAEDSIFAEEVREEIEALAERLLGNVERIDRLLMVLSELRASVGRANAESGTAADALICLAIRRPRSQPAFVPTAGGSRIEPRVRDVRGGTI